MNFCINLFVALCFISRLGAVEIELNAPSNIQESTVVINDPFFASNQQQRPIKLITITDSSGSYYWVTTEIILKSKTGHKTSFMVVNCSQKDSDEAKQFIIDVCNALKEINNVSVGQMLLEDICRANNGLLNLVIFNTGSFRTMIEQIDKNQQLKDAPQKEAEILKKIPDSIQSLFCWNNTLQIPLYEQLSSVISFNYCAFANKKLSGFFKNVLYIEEAEIENILWDIKSRNAYKTIETIPLHLHLFHELNHYRHYTSNEKTYNENGEAYLTINNGLTSLKNFKIGDKRVIMNNSEEELQQIGYTITKQNDEIVDRVNETAYRIQKDMVVRFPYNCDNLDFIRNVEGQNAEKRKNIQNFDEIFFEILQCPCYNVAYEVLKKTVQINKAQVANAIFDELKH